MIVIEQNCGTMKNMFQFWLRNLPNFHKYIKYLLGLDIKSCSYGSPHQNNAFKESCCDSFVHSLMYDVSTNGHLKLTLHKNQIKTVLWTS